MKVITLKEAIKTGHVPVGFSDAQIWRAQGLCQECGGEMDNPANFAPEIVRKWKICGPCASKISDPLGDINALLAPGLAGDN